MSGILLGANCAVVFGLIDIALMIRLSFLDKTAAMTGAFISRFAIGVVIGASNLPLAGWASDLIFGLLISLPDAIITKAYAPILISGIIGSTIIGFVVGRWGSH